MSLRRLVVPPLRRLAARLGFELVERRKLRATGAQLVATLDRARVDAVIDVGANQGQFVRGLREGGWQGKILSFEPIPSLREGLARLAAADPAWEVAPAMALGADEGTATLERSVESDMSSLLPQSDLLRAISPSSRVAERIEVPLARLDGRAAGIAARPWRRLFVKVDVQGAEPAVLAGMAGLWDRIVGLQLELALLPLYEGERPWLEVVQDLAERGFTPYLLVPGYFARALGRQVQVDVVFYRDVDAGSGPAPRALSDRIG